MKMTSKKNRELFNLSVIVIITLIFSAFTLSIDLIDKIRTYLPVYTALPINDYIIKIIFLWLVVTLGITYQRWREAINRRRELEDIIASINSDVLIVIDRTGKVIMCNDSVKGTFGYDLHEVLNQNIDMLYAEYHSVSFKKDEIISKLAKDGFYVEQLAGRKKTNEEIPLEVITYNRKNHDGAVLLLRDITERQKTEEKLEKYRNQLETLVNKRTVELTTRNKQLQEEINERKQSNEALQKTRDYLDNVIESSLDPVVIVDVNGCIERVNESFLEMLGYKEEEVIGKHTTEFSPSVEGPYESTTARTVEITQELIKQSKKMLEKLFEEGKVCNWERYFIRKDQKVVPVESNIVFLYDHEQNMTGGVGILRDITERRKAEEESLEARNFLQNIFDTTADGIMVTDDQGCIVKINRAIEKMLGYCEDELVGKYTTELGPQDEKHAQKRKIIFEQLFEKGYATHWETEWFRKDGSMCPVEINITFLKDKDGNLYQAVAGIRDITERKKAEQKIKDAKEFLEKIFKTTTDGIIVTDNEGTITVVNEATESMLGYTKGDLIGEGAHIFKPEGEEHEIISTAYVERLFEEVTVTGFELVWLKKDGSLIDVEVNAALLRGDDNEVTGAVSTIRDITERKEFEEKLKKSEEKYRGLIENANDAIISINENGEIIDFNEKAEALFGYSRDEILGKPAFLLIPVSEREEWQHSFEKLTMVNKNILPKTVRERKGLRKDGSELTIEYSIFSFEMQGESIFSTFVRDITERKEMEHKLLQSEKLKSLGELAGGVAHDFNNVLSAILGRVQLLKMQCQTPPNLKEKRKSMKELVKSLEIIERASFDGAETVRRIQEFSRKRSDDRDFSRVDINELFENVLEFTRVRWKNEAESKGININIQKEFSPLPPTAGSASELREVFTNLINNALDAMPQGGSIILKTAAENNHIVINIEDTGVGIPLDIQNRIFDPFFTTKGVQSTGLGMSISYGIINRHKGTILVDSREGKGTTFTIKLPLSEKTAQGEEIIKQPDKEPKKAKILVIEDEEEVRQLLHDILISGGHEVEVAPDGNRGLKLFQSGNFDLVFTDLGMPEISGWEVAETVKRINNKVPVAVITGWNVELRESEMKEKGVNLVAHKPFEVNKILDLVQEGIALKERFNAA